jgi:heptosyltransferase II
VNAPKKILVRGTNWLGDAVMTTPALIRLREQFRGAQITLLTPEKLRDLWPLHPAVDDILTFNANDGLIAIAGKLRAEKFDLALVLPNSPRSALEVFLAGIPQRIGYARPWRNAFLTRTVAARTEAVRMRKRSPAEINALIANPPPHSSRPAPGAHQIHEYLHLAATLGANAAPLPPCLVVTAAEVEEAIRKFGLLEAVRDGRPVLGLNPGAEYGPAKRWPAEKFAAAARELSSRTDCVWVLFGGKSDLTITSHIQSAIGNPQSAIINLAGKTSLRELMALLRACRVLLTNDTGPMHVAAALDVPVVVPFGSTSPELTGPGLPGDPRHRLLLPDAPCSPCFLRECPIDFRCLNGLAVERVVEAVIRCGAF